MKYRIWALSFLNCTSLFSIFKSIEPFQLCEFELRIIFKNIQIGGRVVAFGEREVGIERLQQLVLAEYQIVASYF